MNEKTIRTGRNTRKTGLLQSSILPLFVPTRCLPQTSVMRKIQSRNEEKYV